jgi:hypothetical protein
LKTHPLKRNLIWPEEILPRIEALLLQYFGIEYASNEIIWIGLARRRQSVNDRLVILDIGKGKIQANSDYDELYELPSYAAAKSVPAPTVCYRNDVTVLYVIKAPEEFDNEAKMKWDTIRQSVFMTTEAIRNGVRVVAEGKEPLFGPVWVETMMWDEREVGDFNWDR